MMMVEEIKNRDIRDDSRHFTMTSDKGGTVEFSVSDDDNRMYAYEWVCPEEGRKFLEELEKYADENGLKLIVVNVINPKLETVLRKAGYKECYVEISDLDGDIIQTFEKK